MSSYKPKVLCEIFIGNTRFASWNDGKTSPKFKVQHEDGNTTYAGHAEMRALRKIPKGVKPSSLRVYVTRVKKNGDRAMAKPCVHCQAHLWRAGIKAKHVWFTNEEGRYERFTGQATSIYP